MSAKSKDPEHFGLNDQQRRCLDFYRSDRELNQTNAYLRAYPNCNSRDAAKSKASKLVTSDNGQSYLKAQAVKEDLGDDNATITVGRLVQELKRAALFNPKVLFDKDGRLKALDELPDHVARAIGSIKVKRTPEDDTKPMRHEVIEIKLISKEKTLELLGKHLVMFTEKFQIESEEAMHTRVRAEIVAAGEEILSQVLANTKRQRAINQAGPVPDIRPESPVETIDNLDPEYIASLL